MKMLTAVLAVAAAALLITPATGAGPHTKVGVGAGELEVPGLNVSKAPSANSSPGFDQFFQEFNGMVRSWWEHGGFRTTEDKWKVVAQEVLRPGQKLPHFVVSVWRESRGKLELQFVLSFSIPPFAQGNLFLASHAAYDATLGAIMGETRFQGRLEWKGLDIGETI